MSSNNTLNVSNNLTIKPSLGVKNEIEADQARKKIILGRGYSLMDWIRFTKESVDLAGNKGILRKVTYEELAKHDKEDDCWMAIYNKVYNITPYMKFHPGGVEELMRGAGKNATDLFNQVHQWVNIQSMLEKCLVGNLVGTPPVPLLKEKEVKPLSKDYLSTKSKESIASSDYVQKNQDTPVEIPVLDSYQSVNTCNVVLYSKCRNLKKDCLSIDKSFDSNNPNFVCLHLYTPYSVYKYILEIPAPIEDDYDVKISKEGKIELILYKIEKIHWWQMCPKLKFNAEIVNDIKSGTNFRQCELVKRTNLTHDTSLYVFNLPNGSRMHVPIGHHVFLRFLEIKPYTVISESLLPYEGVPDDGKQVCLMIKHYQDGEMTSQLKKLNIGDKIEISSYTGSFHQSALLKCTELYLICAGSGLTPMTRVLTSSLLTETIQKIRMIFFNKTTQDIIWKEEFDKVEKKYSKFKIEHILSQAETEWTGRKGRITNELVNELIEKNIEKPLFCICGPKPFTDSTKELLKKHGYSDENIFPFLG